jgi:hypothetical protein
LHGPLRGSRLHSRIIWQFSMAVCIAVDNGSCKDRWIHGQRIVDLALCLSALVPKKWAHNSRIKIGLQTYKGHLLLVPCWFFGYLDLLSEVVLQTQIEDRHIWHLATLENIQQNQLTRAISKGALCFRPWE